MSAMDPQIAWFIPIIRSGKKALIKWEEFQERAPAPEEMAEWLRQFPGCNRALVTGEVSRVIVLDVDPRHGGAESLNGRVLPLTRTVRTPSGGSHYYYKYPGGACPSVPGILPGVDLKADRGYVLVPPSCIDGIAYEVVADEPVASCPQWLLEMITQRTRAHKADGHPERIPDRIPEGQRDTTLTSLAGTMRRRGASKAAILAALREENALRCDPPLLDSEVARIAHSVSRYASEADNKGLASQILANVPDLALVLGEVEAFIRKYVVLTPSQCAAVTLWITHVWSIEACDITLYLAVTSPEKQAGKTRLLEVLELLLPNPLRVANISVAALFRSLADLSSGRLAILLDEADAVFHPKGNHEDLRALLNAGYRRGAVVARCNTEDRSFRVVRYDAFGAKIIAAIGDLPDTVVDRSIPIRMQRCARREVTRFLRRKAEREAAQVRDMLRAWATPHVIETLRAAQPDIPVELDDRAADGWESLLAIADLAGGDWPQRARQAALELHVAQGAGESTRTLLLRHVLEAFEQAGVEFIPTIVLLKALINREDGPWPTWWANDVEAGRTKGPAAKLAALLRPFGITSSKQRVGEETPRGYSRAAFVPVWQRWLPPLPATTFKTPQLAQLTLDAGFGDPESRNTAGFVPTSETCESLPQMQVVPSVPSSPPPVDTPALRPFDDRDRRAVVMRMGETLDWPKFEFKQGAFISAGEGGWRTFAAAASGEDITLALRALEQIQ